MKLGTHNSLTAYKALGWYKIIDFIGHFFARCQRKGNTIEKQLEQGVRWFNLQVTLYNNDWYGSHGLIVYDVRLCDVLKTLNDFVKRTKEKVYVQIYDDKNLFTSHEEWKFEYMIDNCFSDYGEIIYQRIHNENINKTSYEYSIDGEEHYWTMTWAKNEGKKWYHYLPLPCVWSKKISEKYKDNCKSEYLMLDFV